MMSISLVWRFILVAAIPLTPVLTEHELLVGAKGSRVYHTQPECPSLKKIAVDNRVTFANVSEAESDGRRQCRHCERLDAKSEGETGTATKSSSRKIGRARRGDTPAASQPVGIGLPDSEVQWVRIVKVLPGGGLRTDTGETLCLWGVRIPLPDQDQEPQSMAMLEKAVMGRSVSFQLRTIDQVADRDFLGRARGFLMTDDGRKDLGAELLRNGLAWLDREMHFELMDEYEQHETEAWESGRGVWKRLSGAEGRREVMIGRYARQYHSIGCKHAVMLSEATTVTINEARARRLSPCADFRANSGEAAPSPGARANSNEQRHGKD